MQRLQSLRYFALGYRYGRRFPAADPPIPEAAREVGPLEAYFDAHTEGPGVWKWRHYFEIYERHLDRFRGTPVHIVEIGVLGGGSLQMWRDYFGPETHVYGIDIDPESRALERDGVEIFIGDQGDRSFWERFLETAPTIDVVIDDGGHTARQQAVTVESLLAHVRPGGVYICEDIFGPFQPFHSFVDGLTRPLSDIGMPLKRNPASALQQQVASVHRYPILTVIEKSASCTSSFEAPRRGTVWPARAPHR
ncbi:MAG: class I SAM-dependent methyltransferase [Solirubrobacteraceae bacterium]